MPHRTPGLWPSTELVITLGKQEHAVFESYGARYLLGRVPDRWVQPGLVRVLLVQILLAKKRSHIVHLRRHDSQQPLLLQHHRVAGRKLQLCAPQNAVASCALQLLAHTTRRYIKQTAR